VNETATTADLDANTPPSAVIFGIARGMGFPAVTITGEAGWERLLEGAPPELRRQVYRELMPVDEETAGADDEAAELVIRLPRLPKALRECIVRALGDSLEAVNRVLRRRGFIA
jgi:hypothetical protein